MVDTTDITTKLGESNRILAQLVQTVADRADSWSLSGVLPVIEGGTGVTTYPDLVTALGLVIGVNVQAYNASALIRPITFVINGGGAAITTGVKGDLYIPYACTIDAITMLADQSGSIVVDIWKDVYGSYPPTVADSICGASKPTISASNKSQDTTLTGWTTSVAARSTLRFNVDSVSTIQALTLTLNTTLT